MNITTSNISYNSATSGASGAYYGPGDLIIDKSTFYGQNSINSIVETPCVPGRYHGLNFECFDCGAGNYQPKADFTGCLPCEVGKSSNEQTGSSCKQCTVGEYQDEEARPICKRCAAGRYSTATQ